MSRPGCGDLQSPPSSPHPICNLWDLIVDTNTICRPCLNMGIGRERYVRVEDELNSRSGNRESRMRCDNNKKEMIDKGFEIVPSIRFSMSVRLISSILLVLNYRQ